MILVVTISLFSISNKAEMFFLQAIVKVMFYVVALEEKC